MSLVLCLENSEGKKTAIQVQPEDDFASFLQKAKAILGYEVDISCITNNRDVPLTDNIYQFLIRAELDLAGEEQLHPDDSRGEDSTTDGLNIVDSSSDHFKIEDTEAESLGIPDSNIGNSEIRNHDSKELKVENQDSSEDSNIVDPGIGELRMKDPEMVSLVMEEQGAETEPELLYVLEDGSHASAGPVKLDSEGNYILQQEPDGTLSYVMLNEEDPAHSNEDFYLGGLQIVNNDNGKPFPLQLVSQEMDFVPQFHEYVQEYSNSQTVDEQIVTQSDGLVLNLQDNDLMIDDSYGEVKVKHEDESQRILLDASNVKTYSKQDIFDLLKESSVDSEQQARETQILDGNQQSTIHESKADSRSNIPNIIRPRSVLSKDRNLNKVTDCCHFCQSRISDSVHKTYIFDENDQRELRKASGRRKQGRPKIICGVCLARGYEQQPRMPRALGKDHFLVIRNKTQMTFKKKTRFADNFECVNLNANKLIQVSGETSDTSHFMIMENESNEYTLSSVKQETVEAVDTHTKNSNKVEYVCRFCGLVLQQLALVVTHCLVHRLPNPAPLACVLCHLEYKSFQDLRQHIRTEHSIKKKKLQTATRLNQNTLGIVKQTQHSNCIKQEENTSVHNTNSMVIVESKKPDEKSSIILCNKTEDVKTEYIKSQTGFIMLCNSIKRNKGTAIDIEEGVNKQHAAHVRVEVFPAPGPPACPRTALRTLQHCLRTAVKVEAEEWLNEDTGELLKTENPVYAIKNPDSPLSQDQSGSESDGGVWIVQAGSWGEDPPTPRAYQCPLCKKRYSSAERMSRHACTGGVSATQDPGIEGSNSKAQHICGLCPARFHTKVRLQFHTRHMHPVGGVGALHCLLCPRLQFTDEAGLYDHVHFAHPRVKRHICPEPDCGKAFHLKASLTTHARCHAGERTHKCDVCAKTFFDRQTLGEHSVTHLEVKPFQCHICFKFLNRRSRLRMHLRTHASEPVNTRVLVCKRCDQAFASADDAEVHVTKPGECLDAPEIVSNPDDPGPGLFEEPSAAPLGSEITLEAGTVASDGSENLQKESEELQNLSTHAKGSIVVIQIDKVYRCEYCEKVFYLADSLNVHRACHAGIRSPFICHVCGAAFSSYSRCTTHKTTHGFYRAQAGRGARASSPLQQDSFPVVKHFLCEVCGKSYLHWTYLQVHRRQKHSDNVHMYSCKVCGDQFPNSWGIAYHRKKVHGQLSGISSDTTTERCNYSCSECGIVLQKASQLAQHRRTVHGNVDKGTDDNLNAGTNANPSKSGVYVCGECGKRFITKVGFNGHMKGHREANGGMIRPYRCQECGKAFVHAAGLSTHARRVHMREANFACNRCEKAFYSACDLQSHLRRHTGEKPFPCDVCGHAFRTKGMRNEHLRIHTGERPYPCDVCGLAFRRSYALKNHRLIHSGERGYPCGRCPRTFRLRSDLNTHVRQKHPDIIETTPEHTVELPVDSTATEEPAPLLRGDVEIFTEIFEEEARGTQFLAGREYSLGLLLPKEPEDFCRSPDDARRFRELFSSVENN